MSEDEKKVAEIEARVRPTICHTVGSKGISIEGRISKDDFEYLLASWRAWKCTSKTYSSLANLTANEENEALAKALSQEIADHMKALDEIDALKAQFHRGMN